MNLLPIPAATKRSKRLDDGAESGGYFCLCCAKPLTNAAVSKAWFVQMTTSNQLAPVESDHPKSQGFFPVGSECAKLVPITHRRKFPVA